MEKEAERERLAVERERIAVEKEVEQRRIETERVRAQLQNELSDRELARKTQFAEDELVRTRSRLALENEFSTGRNQTLVNPERSSPLMRSDPVSMEDTFSQHRERQRREEEANIRVDCDEERGERRNYCSSRNTERPSHVSFGPVVELGNSGKRKEVFHRTEGQERSASIPMYRSGDDPDVFLMAFEKIARMNGWRMDSWLSRLCPYLNGRLLELFSNLPPEEMTNNEYFVDMVRDHFGLHAENYRVKFRECVKSPKETYKEYVHRLSTLQNRSLSKPGTAETMEQLVETIMLEQIFNHLSSEERSWLLDREPRTSHEVAQLLDQYHMNRVGGGQVRNDSSLSRQQASSPSGDRNRSRSWSPSKSYRPSVSRNSSWTRSSSYRGHYPYNRYGRGDSSNRYGQNRTFSSSSSSRGYGNSSNYNRFNRSSSTPSSNRPMSPFRQNAYPSSSSYGSSSNTMRTPSRNLTCYECGQPGHIKNFCPKLQNEIRKVQHVAILDRDSEEPTAEDEIPLYEINKGRSAGYTTIGCIEGRVVLVLRDTGSDVTIIKKSVVVNPKYTGEYQVYVGAFGHTVRLPVALVYLSTVHGKGETKCCISPDLVVACILGNKTVGEWKKKVVSVVQTS